MRYTIALFVSTIWVVMIICLASPATVGMWQAQRDIAYQSVVDATYGDFYEELDSDI